MTSFLEEQNRKLEGSRDSVRRVSDQFKIKRFDLSNKASKNDFQGNNLFDFAFKSFWIVDTNNTSFKANMVVNPKGDGGSPLPLKSNMSMAFEYRQNGCAIECDAQPGVWIEVLFAYETDISPGFVTQESSGSSVINEGSNYSSSNPTISNSGASILVAPNTNRKKAVIQNVSGVTIWVGKQVDLASADYQKKCLRILSGDSFEWRNVAQLNARVESGSTDAIAIMELT